MEYQSYFFNDLSSYWWVIVFIDSVFCALFCRGLAVNKGYDQRGAMFSGFIFGLLALIYYAGLPDQIAQRSLEKIHWLLETRAGDRTEVR